MSKHTPGPWNSKHWHGGKYTIHDAQGTKIADFVHPDVVNVMAAAPQLLEALENCRSKILSMLIKARVFEDALGCWEIIEADAVIAKAKGEQK